MKRLLIAIDAGHGAPDPGARGNGMTEADLAGDIANNRLSMLARAAGHRTILTRPGSSIVALAARAAAAVQAGAELFISIHINAAVSRARGIQTWYHGADLRSSRLAARIQHTITDALPDWAGNAARACPDTERYRSGFAVLRGASPHMPAILLEVGFISNPADAALLRDPVLVQATCLETMAAVAASLAHGEL